MDKVKCNGCDWEWDLSDGGHDPYVCHKCGKDNTNDYMSKIRVSKEDQSYIEECIANGEVLREDLGRWFKEKWVDVSRKVDGKHPPCGRKDADGDSSRKGYPKCRPSKKVSKETPKISSSYDKKEKKSMTSQKRRAEKKEPKNGKGNTPTFTKFDENHIIRLVGSNLMVESLKTLGPKLKNINENNNIISEGLMYHINNDLPIVENVYRIYSEEFFNLYNEVRQLHEENVLEVAGVDLELIQTDLGKTSIYEGMEVYLDIPFIEGEEEYLVEAIHGGKNVKLNKPFRTPGGPKKFAVYVKTPKGTIKKVTFGDPNLRVRNNNKAAAKSFRARHNCKAKKDRTTPGYWSCNISRYRKALGIKSSNPW
jgi:hypothetical protein